MEIGETLYVTTRAAWRKWLAKHHRDKKDIWLIYCKKSSRKASISYDAAVEEALCYGWIDGQIRSMNVEKYAGRFSPRRPGSEWSKSNKARALMLLQVKKVTPAGRAVLPPDVLCRSKKRV